MLLLILILVIAVPGAILARKFSNPPARTKCEYCGGKLFFNRNINLQDSIIVCENHFLGESMRLLGSKTCCFMDYPTEKETEGIL
jgi:hypothetical protein